MHEVKYEPPVPDNWTPTHEALQAANDRMWSMIYRYVMAKVAADRAQYEEARGEKPTDD